MSRPVGPVVRVADGWTVEAASLWEARQFVRLFGPGHRTRRYVVRMLADDLDLHGPGAA